MMEIGVIEGRTVGRTVGQMPESIRGDIDSMGADQVCTVLYRRIPAAQIVFCWGTMMSYRVATLRYLVLKQLLLNPFDAFTRDKS